MPPEYAAHDQFSGFRNYQHERSNTSFRLRSCSCRIKTALPPPPPPHRWLFLLLNRCLPSTGMFLMFSRWSGKLLCRPVWWMTLLLLPDQYSPSPPPQYSSSVSSIPPLAFACKLTLWPPLFILILEHLFLLFAFEENQVLLSSSLTFRKPSACRTSFLLVFSFSRHQR